MEQNKKNLIKQFAEATGIKNIDINSKEFLSEFYEWIKLRKATAKTYTYFLEYMGFNFNDYLCTEVGKGKHDTVVEKYDTSIITSTNDEFKSVETDRIIRGNMCVYEGMPFLISSDIKRNICIDQLPNEYFTTFMTQNPYSQLNISGWEDLHNYNDNNIIVGVYGNVSDKDIKDKLKMMQVLKDKLDGRYIENMEVYRDGYFYALGTMPSKRETSYIKPREASAINYGHQDLSQTSKNPTKLLKR